MLSDLDWSAVSHAYGPATDLPDVLRALRSEEEQHRADAVRQFRAKVLHQGSLYPAGAAAAPFLIELLADDGAPDRTLGHELLADLMTAEAMDWLGADPDPVPQQTHDAVRAGVPTYLRLLGNPDRNARGLSAHLLSFFPEDAPQVTPVLIARLAVETDRVVGPFLCLTAGMIGDPDDAELRAAVARWRDQPSRINRWTVLMGLVRLTGTPDADMLEQLCDCLFHGPEELYGWTFHEENPARAASIALGDLPVASVPGLAAMLLDRLAAGGEDLSRFYYALDLLLGLVFPDGPLPDGASPGDLSPQQYAAAHVVLHSGALEHPSISGLLRKCNLPGDEATLRSWCPDPPA
ncbi:hypothetical protein ACQPZJ_07170 [Actinoplanes sp. CA-054009]